MGIIQSGEIIESLPAIGVVKAPDAQVFVVDPSDGAGALQDAIDDCIADQGDIIVVLQGNHAVTSQVEFNKRGIIVVGAGFGHPHEAHGESFLVNADSGLSSGAVAKITDPCRIINLGFAGRDTTAESLVIDSEGAGGFNGGFASLEGCRFPCTYGAMDVLIRIKGGSLNYIRRCTFDGLFVGVGTAGIQVEASTGGVTADFLRVIENEFSGMGSGKHAIVHKAADDPPNDVWYHRNALLPGFSEAEGKFLDNNNVASSGLVTENYVATLANQGAAMENLTNSNIGFGGNIYSE